MLLFINGSRILFHIGVVDVVQPQYPDGGHKTSKLEPSTVVGDTDFPTHIPNVDFDHFQINFEIVSQNNKFSCNLKLKMKKIFEKTINFLHVILSERKLIIF